MTELQRMGEKAKEAARFLACAGALGVRLAGDAVYGGVVCKKEYIGDAAREIEAADIRRANRLMYVTAVLLLILTLALKTLAALAAGISL